MTYLIDKKEKMTIARVEMCWFPIHYQRNESKMARHTFDPKSAYLIEMIAVYVRVYAEQPSHDGAYGIFECTRERGPYIFVRGERVL